MKPRKAPKAVRKNDLDAFIESEYSKVKKSGPARPEPNENAMNYSGSGRETPTGGAQRQHAKPQFAISKKRASGENAKTPLQQEGQARFEMPSPTPVEQKAILPQALVKKPIKVKKGSKMSMPAPVLPDASKQLLLPPERNSANISGAASGNSSGPGEEK